MKSTAAALLLSLLACDAGEPELPNQTPVTPVLPPAEIAAVSAKVKARYDKGSKYMEGRDLGPVDVPEWKGYPTHQWGYTQTDRNGTKRPATVIMLNPSAEQLARWVVRASYDLQRKYDPVFCDALLKHVFLCSGGQFVVRGICLEDMDGDGIHTAYPFRDGVTVKLNGIPGYPNRPLTTTESNIALNAPLTAVTQFAKRARLQSTQPAEWAAFTGTQPVEDAAWLSVVREEYQRAWNADSNRMLTATANALHSAPKTAPTKQTRLEKVNAEIEKCKTRLESLPIDWCPTGAPDWKDLLGKIEQSLATEKDPVKIAELNKEREEIKGMPARIAEAEKAITKEIQKLKALETEKAALDQQ
jgi:hypothetical protein